MELDGPLDHGSYARLVVEPRDYDIRCAIWDDPTALFDRYGVPSQRTALRRGTSVLSGKLADLLGYAEQEIDTWELQMALGGVGRAT